jgi:hypothetical protein
MGSGQGLYPEEGSFFGPFTGDSVGVIAVSFRIAPVHPLDDTLTELCRLRDKAIRRKTKRKYQALIDQVWPIIAEDQKDYYREDDEEWQ